MGAQVNGAAVESVEKWSWQSSALTMGGYVATLQGSHSEREAQSRQTQRSETAGAKGGFASVCVCSKRVCVQQAGGV